MTTNNLGNTNIYTGVTEDALSLAYQYLDSLVQNSILLSNSSLPNNEEISSLFPNLVQTSLTLTYQYLDSFFHNPVGIETAFGTNYDPGVANQLFSAFAQGNFSEIPEVKILSDQVLGATNGGYSADTNEIYLNERFLVENVDNVEAVANVLTEEIGHFIDAQINTVDSQGDEGDILARLVLGEELSPEVLEKFKSDQTKKSRKIQSLLLSNVDNHRFNLINESIATNHIFKENINNNTLEEKEQEEKESKNPLGSLDIMSSDTVISRTIAEVSNNETTVKDNLTVVFAENLEINESSELDVVDIYEIVDTALQDSYQYLSKFRFAPDYIEKLETAFGEEFDQVIADELFDKFAEDNFTDIPTIKVVNREEIYGGNAAFSADTGLIYLTVEFLVENQKNSPKVTDVLLEENGHFIDSKINKFDSPGDEGDIFSELVQGNTLTEEDLQVLKKENDQATVISNAQGITIIPNAPDITIENNTTLRIGTWNVYHGNSHTGNITIPEHLRRINYISRYGMQHGIDILVIQEVFNSKNNPLLEDLYNKKNGNPLKKYDNTGLTNLTAGYDYEIMLREYPNTPNTPHKQTTDGYLILYNPATISGITNLSFYNQNQFVHGTTQYRPPVYFQATDKANNVFNLLTWHNEINGNGTNAANEALSILTNGLAQNPNYKSDHYIILGDFNVKSSYLNNPNNNLLTNEVGIHHNLSYITTNQGNVTNLEPHPNDQAKLKSDAHYALFAEVNTTSIPLSTFGNAQVQNTTPLTAGPTPKMSPYTSNNITYEYEDNQPVFNAENQFIQIGNKQGDGDFFSPLINVDGGKVTISTDQNDGKQYIYITQLDDSIPKIYSNTGYHQHLPLFTGELTLDTDNLESDIAELENGSEPDFKLGGLEVTFTDLAFVDDHLELQGNVKLPDALGGLVVSVEVDEEKGTNNRIILGYPGEEFQDTDDHGNTITKTIGDYGVYVTGGSLILPGEQTFNALNLLEVKTKDVGLNFNFDDEEIKLEGEFIIPTFNNATLDLSNGKHITVKDTDDGLEFAWNGDFSVDDINIYGDWSLNDININIDKDFDETIGNITGSAKLYTSENNYLDLSLAFNDGKLQQISASSPVGTDFTFLGTEVDITNLNFTPDRNLDDEISWDPELQVQGMLTLPEALHHSTIQITGNNYLVINNEGIDLTGGRIDIPNFDVDLLGLLKIEGKDVSLDYYKENGERNLRIQGEVKIPSLYNVTADFTGSNYIQIGEHDVEVVGTISADNIIIQKDIWEIKHAELAFDTTKKQVESEAIFLIPSGIEVGADVILQKGHLSYVDIKADHLNKPIGATGAYLQTIEGRYEDKKSQDEQSQDEQSQDNSSSFGGNVAITAGAEVNIDLPSFLGGGVDGALIELDVNGEITNDHLKASGDLTVLGGLIQGDASVELNWANNFLSADSHFNILDGLITTETDFLADFDEQLEVYLFGEAQVRLPHHIPWIGGKKLGDGEVFFQYSDDGNYHNDYIAAWGHLHWVGTVGIKVDFAGNYHVIHSKQARHIANEAKEIFNQVQQEHEERIEEKNIGNNIVDVPINNVENINGTNGDDTLHGDGLNDTISGLNGNDLLSGEGGNDLLSGDNDNDFLHGGDGDDTLSGGDGDDYLFGDEGSDILHGNDGNDYLYGDDHDHLYGDSGDDYLFGGDEVYGGSGNDTIVVSTTIDYGLFNGNESDVIAVFSGVNQYDSDTVSYGLYGENLSITLQDAGAGFPEAESKGTVVIGNGLTSHHLISIENVIGGSGNDTLIGNNQDNHLEGSAGNDNINGNGGNDILEGGDGNDTLTGGANTDIFLFNSITDSIDTITDFNTSEGDKIEINIDTFGPLATHLFSYDPNTGALSYDEFVAKTNRSFYLLSDADTWENSQQQAENLGGNLVTINNQEEQEWLEETFGTTERFWIGLTDQQTEGTFEWISGETSTYRNWYPGEPNNGSGNQDYAYLNWREAGKWDDLHGEDIQRGIIEILVSEYNGHYYLVSNADTWENAQQQAQNLGGNLVTINNQEEQEWLEETFGTTERFWIGLTDQQTEGTFQWINGETSTYSNWYPGEPNNLGGNQDYAYLNFKEAGKWDDRHGEHIQRGIIEISLSEYNGHYYLLSNADTWENAQQQAQNLGGNLVTINNQEEQEWLQETFGTTERFWIGLTDQQSEGTFEWINGETSTYSNWYPGEPNNLGDNQDYAYLNFKEAGKWDDRQGEHIQRGIIEIDLENYFNYFQTEVPNFQKEQIATLSNQPSDFNIETDITFTGTYVELFEHSNYQGKSLKLTPGTYSHTDLFRNGFDENILSSLKVPNGWQVAIYNGNFFEQQLGNYTDDISVLESANNNKTTSVIISSPENDFLIAGTGNDSLQGLEGNDTIYGDSGDDILAGDYGNDVLNGDFGNDTLSGGLGDDRIDGGNGNDHLSEQGDVDFTLSNWDYFNYNGHTYILGDAATWDVAQQQAENLGGNLVTINNANEEQWLIDTFGKTHFWIGLTDQATEGTFEWISGEPLTYTNWKSGEPNDYGAGEDYAVINYLGLKQWNDYNGQQTFPGIIEINQLVNFQTLNGLGTDTLINIETVELQGGESNNRLDATSSTTRVDLQGLGGDDDLIGSKSHDTLTGGAGNDTFVFKSLSDGIDTITDFQVSMDTIEIDKTGFSATSHSQFSFDSNNGALTFDSHQFATLENLPSGFDVSRDIVLV